MTARFAIFLVAGVLGIWLFSGRPKAPSRTKNVAVAVPVLLGSGEGLFDDVDDPGLEPLQVSHSPLAIHVRYRVGR